MEATGRRLILGLVALAMALQPAVAGAQSTENGIYVALGDSLARGVGATIPAQLGYVPRLFNYFRGTAHAGVDSLVNLGVPGETSTTLLTGAQLTNALAAINDPSTDVRVLTLDIGGNDLAALLGREPCRSDPAGLLCRQTVGATLMTFTTNYILILTQLSAALAADPGDETIMVMTYFNYLSGTGSELEPVVDAVLLGPDQAVNCAAPQTTWGLNDVITCVALPYGITVVDVYPVFVGKGATLTHIAEQDFHPNTAGYALIASAFMRASRL
jgi:lysophospholipase L1-like esterase